MHYSLLLEDDFFDDDDDGGDEAIYDPIEPLNRLVWSFNEIGRASCRERV